MAMNSEEEDAGFKQPMALRPMRRPGVKPSAVAEVIESNANSVMSSFKLRTLNATLQFVKTDSSLVLRYSDMTNEQAEFVTELISQCSSQSSTKEMDVGFGYKRLYAPLAEAMRIFGLKYEFQLINEETLNEMKQLKLQKIPKQGTVTDHYLGTPSTSKTKIKKNKGPTRKVLNAIERVDNIFKRNTVQQIKAFLDDDSKNFLQFDEITPMEMRFIKHMKNIPNKLEYIQQFDFGTRGILDAIRYTLQRNTHKFRIEVSQEKPGNKRSYLRYAVMWKVGAGKTLSKKDREVFLNARNVFSLNDKSDTSSTCSEQSNSKKNEKNKERTVSHNEKTQKDNTGANKSESDDLVSKTLTKLKDFLSDDTQASLMITQASKVQMEFLENVLKGVYEVNRFPPQIGTILAEVYNLVNQNKDVFKVMGKKSNVDKKSDKYNLTFMKIPVYPKLKPQKHVTRSETASSSANESQINPNPSISIQKEKTNGMNEIQNVLCTATTNKEKNLVDLELTKSSEPSPPRTATKRSWYADTDVWKDSTASGKESRSVSLTRNGSQISKWRDQSVESLRGNAKVPAKLQESRSMTSLVPSSSVTSLVQHSSVTSLVQKSSVTSQPGNKLSRAKVKLMEGLNQPVVSEKGLKMMKMMGWQGGALGARGEGIMEPITLPVDLARRSGFGHVSQPQVTKLPSLDLYTQLPSNITKVELLYFNKRDLASSTLEAVLDLLTTDKGAIEIVFKSMISAKGWSFVKHVVTSLNTKNRKSLFSSGDNPVLIEGIISVMRNTNYIITACWGVRKNNVLFVRHKGLYDPHDSENWCSVIIFENINKILKKTVIINKDLKEKSKGTPQNSKNDATDKNVQEKTIDNRSVQEKTIDNRSVQEKTIDNRRVQEKTIDNRSVQEKTTDNKMVDGDTFRYYILVQILDYCKKSDITIDKGNVIPTEKKIKLKGTMTSKQVAFIEDLVKRLNNRTRSSSDSKTECSIFKEIVQEMTGYDLNVLFPVADDTSAFKTILLQKVEPHEPNKKTKKKSKNDKIKTENEDVYETLKKPEECPNMFNPNNFAEAMWNQLKNKNESLDNKENINNNSQKSINRNTSKNVTTEIITDKSHDENPKSGEKRRTFTRDSIDPEHMFENQSNSNDDCICCDDTMESDVIVVENEIEVIVIDDDEDDDEKSHDTVDNDTQNGSTEIVFDSWEDRIEDNNAKSDINYTEGVKDMRSNSDDMITEIEKSVENLDLNSPRVTQDLVQNDISKTDDDNKSVSDIDPKEINKDTAENIQTIIETLTQIINSEMSSNDNENEPNFTDLENDENTPQILTKNNQVFNHVQKLSNLLDASNNENTTQDLEIAFIQSENKSQKDVVEESQMLETNESSAGKRRLNPSRERTSKKFRYEEFYKRVIIVPKNYPQSKIDNKTAGKVQNSIVRSIDNGRELPLLKCQGIKDGALLYSCHSEKSLETITSILESFDDLKMAINEEIEGNNRYKMAFRINTFIDEKVDDILSRLEMYNEGIMTKDWVFVKKEQCSEYTVIFVEMDEVSYNYIRASKFCMYAGIDEAKFSFVWN